MFMADTVNGIVSLFLMMAVGFALYKAGWIEEKGEALLVKLALKVAVPCALFCNAVTHLAKGLAVDDPLCFLMPVGTIALTLALGLVLVRVLQVPKRQRGVAASIFAVSNTIIIGLPVCTSIFGETGIPYVILYYAANTIIFWTVGASLVAADGGEKFRLNWKSVRRVFSPALLGFLLGLAVVLSGITVPTAIYKAINTMGQSNTAICMILVGTCIGKLGFREMFRFGRAGILAMLGRTLIGPAIVLAACLLLGFQGIPARVYLVMAAMPAMSQSVPVAKNYGADDLLSARLLSASALMMLVTVPLLVLVAEAIL